MKAKMGFGKRLVRLGLAVLLAFGGVAATASLAACGEKEPQAVTITIACTDEVRQSLVDANIVDAQGFLQQAANQFASRYTDLQVTMRVVAVDDKSLHALGQEGVMTGATAESSSSEAAGAASEGAVAAGANSPRIAGADILFGAYGDLVPAVFSGKAVALDDIITNDMNTYTPGAYLATGKAAHNGLTYLLPFGVSHKVMVIDASMLKACGLESFIAEEEVAPAEGTEEEVAPEEEAEAQEPALGVSYTTAEEAQAAGVAGAVLKTWSEAQWVQFFGALSQLGFGTEGNEKYPLLLSGEENSGDLALTLMQLGGAPLVDEEGYLSLESPEGVSTAAWIAALAKAGVLAVAGEDQALASSQELLAQGRLGMMLVDVADIPQLYADVVTKVEVPVVEAEGEGEETAAVEAEATEGEGVEGEAAEAPAPQVTYTLSREYVFVTMPALSDVALQALAGVGAGSPAEELPAEVVALENSFASVVPAEFYGFAVLDNGNATAVRVAKEFVKFVLSSDEWVAYEACQGLFPTDSLIVDGYERELFWGADLKALADSALSVSPLLPSLSQVKTTFANTLTEAIREGKTPAETTAALNKACNAIMEPAYRAVDLHQ